MKLSRRQIDLVDQLPYYRASGLLYSSSRSDLHIVSHLILLKSHVGRYFLVRILPLLYITVPIYGVCIYYVVLIGTTVVILSLQFMQRIFHNFKHKWHLTRHVDSSKVQCNTILSYIYTQTKFTRIQTDGTVQHKYSTPPPPRLHLPPGFRRL